MFSLQAGLQISVPILLFMLLGMGLKRIGLMGEKFTKHLNKLCFNLFFPAMIFNNVSSADIREIWDMRLLGFALVSVFLWFLLLVLAIPRIQKNRKKAGIMVLALLRSNFAIFGTIIVKAIAGENNMGEISLLVALIVPVANILCLVFIEISNTQQKLQVKELLVHLIKSPLLLAAAAGLLFALLPVRLPGLISKPIDDLAACTMPLSLLLCGATIKLDGIKSNLGQLVIVALGRLVLVPLVMLPVCMWFHFEKLQIIALMSLYMGPTAITVFNIASQYGCEAEFAGQTVAITSLLAPITIFAWIVAMGALGIIS